MKPVCIHSKSFAIDAADFIAKNGRFILGLCGGKTPEPVYTELARLGSQLDWQKVLITFGDERCVGPDHKESNYRMAKSALFDKVEIPPENIFRIHGEDTPEKAALDYEEKLLALAKIPGDILEHDLLLLGLGDDGHTASLFPGTKALIESDRLVVSNYVPKFNSYRITFTYRLINASRNICFLVNDPKKKGVVDEILGGNSEYPAAKVGAKENLTWILGY